MQNYDEVEQKTGLNKKGHNIRQEKVAHHSYERKIMTMAKNMQVRTKLVILGRESGTQLMRVQKYDSRTKVFSTAVGIKLGTIDTQCQRLNRFAQCTKTIIRLISKPIISSPTIK